MVCGNGKFYPQKKKPKVDLLYTYDKSNIDELKNAKGFNKNILPESVISEEQMDGYEYDRTSATQQELMAENKNINTKILKTEDKSDEKEIDFNWDDI